jgi:hypothetical protein
MREFWKLGWLQTILVGQVGKDGFNARGSQCCPATGFEQFLQTPLELRSTVNHRHYASPHAVTYQECFYSKNPR